MPEPSSTLSLTELLGADRRQGRKLVLRGGGLPFQGAEWAAEQRLATTWYQGNPEATQQVLGTKELPSDWEGMWRLTQLLSAPCIFSDEGGPPLAVSDPATLRDIIDSLREDGAFLRVLWECQGKQVVRFGRIGRAAFPHDRMTDIKWNITFEWTGRGARGHNVGAQQNNAQLLEYAKSQAQFVGLLSAAIDIGKLVAAGDPFTIADLQQFADYPASVGADIANASLLVTSKLEEIGELLATAAVSPAAFADAAYVAVTTAIDSFSRLHDTFTQIPSDYTAATGAGAAATARAIEQAGQVLDQVDAALAALVEFAQALHKSTGASTAQGDAQGAKAEQLLATHLCKAGDTFMSLAITYYSDADQAGALALANGLPAYQVAPDPGFILAVPTKAALAQWAGE